MAITILLVLTPPCMGSLAGRAIEGGIARTDPWDDPRTGSAAPSSAVRGIALRDTRTQIILHSSYLGI